ncbi:hypothetical protein [Actinoplanes sp. URMC 104]|uniref:hypothetical protein n=1 Tax=Actinoplanes sp. URMC 104 TaxID=3423409 RepID=UPI003F19A2CE
MRTLLPGALVAVAILAPATPASAAPATTVCTIADDRLDELSGMLATGDGYVVVNDGADLASHRRIFFLNSRCRVTRTVPYASRPRDTEDLARGAGGTVWVADIGDNGRNRGTVALWKLAPGAGRATLHRLTYPDGPHDAEALLVTAGGSPIVVTKDARLYTAAAPGTATTRLTAAGEVSLPSSTTSNPFSFLGRAAVTGAAASPDGRHVVLRTYADAFEFDVPGGDVVAALTGGTPRPIPLPDEPQGESVTYSADGRSLLTVSEGVRPRILRYPLPDRPSPTATAAATPSRQTPSPETPSPGGATPRAGESQAGPPRYLLVVAGGVAALAAGLAVALAVIRSRRRS